VQTAVLYQLNYPTTPKISFVHNEKQTKLDNKIESLPYTCYCQPNSPQIGWGTESQFELGEGLNTSNLLISSNFGLPKVRSISTHQICSTNSSLGLLVGWGRAKHVQVDSFQVSS